MVTDALLPLNSCILGDCHDVMSRIPTGSFDAVITDWPYGVEIAGWDAAVPYADVTEFLRIASGPVIVFGSAPRLFLLKHPRHNQTSTRPNPRPFSPLTYEP